jgi:hypothetical protein
MNYTPIIFLILIYILISLAYVVARTSMFPQLGNGMTMFDYPFMALMLSITIVLFSKCFETPKPPSVAKDLEVLRDREGFTVAPLNLDNDFNAGRQYNGSFNRYKIPCTADYRRLDSDQYSFRRPRVSPDHMSPEELGRNFRETDRHYLGEQMDEISDFATRDTLKRSNSQRDSRLGAYAAQMKNFDYYHRDESTRNSDMLANGSPYDPIWWDNDRGY